jgi:hypothetical protein
VTNRLKQIIIDMNTFIGVNLDELGIFDRRTPEKVRERIEMGDAFLREVVERGKECVWHTMGHRWRCPRGLIRFSRIFF